MRQLYIKLSGYHSTLWAVLGIFILNSCQKDYVDVGLDFRPDLSITIPLLNQDIKLSEFGLDTIAYETITAITIPLGEANGILIPFNRFNRSMTDRFQVSAKAINTVYGSMREKSVFGSDSLLAYIQNTSLAAAYNQSFSIGTTPPALFQGVLKRNQILLGHTIGTFSSVDSLSLRATIENIQNANLNTRVKFVFGADSVTSAVIAIQAEGSSSVEIRIPANGDLPIKASLIDFQYIPLGPLDVNTPLLSFDLMMGQKFLQFDAMLDTVIWTADTIDMFYLDSLSLIAPRSSIEFKPNTNFFFNYSTNIGVPLKRKLTNAGVVIADIATTPGQTTQYPVGNKVIYGVRDTFSFESVYYSTNSSIPANLNTRQITTTDVQAFTQPKRSTIELNANIPFTLNQTLNTPLSIPFIDSASFFDPILSVDVSSDSPYEIELSFAGLNFPSGLFTTDSLRNKLSSNTLSDFSSLFYFDSSNSALSNLTVIPMDSLRFSPKIKLIKNNDSHEIKESSFIKLKPHLTIPINGIFGGFVFSDTLQLGLDTTILHYGIADTIVLEFASRNPATLGINLHVYFLDTSGQSIDHQSITIIDPAPFNTNLNNGLVYVEKKSNFLVQKNILKKTERLAYLLEITGDINGNVRIPAEGLLRLEANIVIP